ncbi:hypothetical protein [Lacinutrix undariae]
MPDHIMFLSFNYTFIDRIYSNAKEFEQYNEGEFSIVKHISIHGTVGENDSNHVIFV